uniref:Uncharacterized protein n=1 Tax=Rhizophora mucronata TaxID=61149 RepID=A0A2P2NHP2_RHIMU
MAQPFSTMQHTRLISIIFFLHLCVISNKLHDL